MHSEHLSNVSASAILIGWLVAVAVTSALVFVLAGLGWMTPEGTPAGWAVAAVALGFLAGGYLTGTRDIEAPILHGVGIGLTSMVAWFALNLLASLFVNGAVGEGLPPSVTAGLLLLQMAAAIAGAWIADRRALRGDNLPGDSLG